MYDSTHSPTIVYSSILFLFIHVPLYFSVSIFFDENKTFNGSSKSQQPTQHSLEPSLQMHESWKLIQSVPKYTSMSYLSKSWLSEDLLHEK
mmetsp:Transcript_19819/g.29248  ORF Transcript_19819/g.29248 Transcript_19819/m.29248 type:complete len:91 (-) Transcript_19819:1820-2092(-)